MGVLQRVELGQHQPTRPITERPGGHQTAGLVEVPEPGSVTLDRVGRDGPIADTAKSDLKLHCAISPQTHGTSEHISHGRGVEVVVAFDGGAVGPAGLPMGVVVLLRARWWGSGRERRMGLPTLCACLRPGGQGRPGPRAATAAIHGRMRVPAVITVGAVCGQTLVMDRVETPAHVLALLRGVVADLAGSAERVGASGWPVWRVAGSGFLDVATTCGPSGALTTVIAVLAEADEVAALVAVGHPFFGLRSGNARGRVGVVIDERADWVEIAELVAESRRLARHRPGPPGHGDRSGRRH